MSPTKICLVNSGLPCKQEKLNICPITEKQRIWNSGVAGPKLLRDQKFGIGQNVSLQASKSIFVWDATSQSTKWLHMLKIWGHGPSSVTMEAAGGASSSCKKFRPWKNVLDIVWNYRTELISLGPSQKNFSPCLLVSQAGYEPAWPLDPSWLRLSYKNLLCVLGLYVKDFLQFVQ